MPIIKVQKKKMEVSGQLSTRAALSPSREPPVATGVGDWAGRRAGLDAMANSVFHWMSTGGTS